MATYQSVSTDSLSHVKELEDLKKRGQALIGDIVTLIDETPDESRFYQELDKLMQQEVYPLVAECNRSTNQFMTSKLDDADKMANQASNLSELVSTFKIV